MNSQTIKSFLFAIFISVLFISCDSSEKTVFNYDQERRQVEKVINSSIGWAKNKDLKALYDVIWNNENYLEVDPSKTVVKGIGEFRKNEAYWMSLNFKAVRYEIKDLKITFSETGNVAWWYCILDDINEWKGKPANWENTRWTGVVEKTEGKWKIMQMHFSFASEK